MEGTESAEIPELPGKQILLTNKCESDSDIPDSRIDEEDNTEVPDDKANQLEEQEPVEINIPD